MNTLIAIFLFLIFLILSAIHFYWGAGGYWENEAVLPTKDDSIKPKSPGAAATFIVAIGLLLIGLFILSKVVFFNFTIPFWINKYGLWIIAAIFIIRAIGEFNYVGFFKKIKHTKFGYNDTKYYLPLCLIIGILAIILELNN